MKTDQALGAMEKELNHLMQRPTGRRAFFTALPVMLAACAAAPQHRQREGDNTGQETRLSVADEQRMTDEYLPKMREEYPPLKDDYAQKYLKDLGQKIVHDNQLHNKPYSYNFTVVKSDMVNAFALPAGEVFVTTPLIAMTDSEAELAGVVGHEIGHIKARHTAERIDKAEREKNKNLLFGLAGAVIGGAAGFGLSKLVCDDHDKECVRRITQYGALAGGAGALLIQKFAFMAHSREDEMEADRIGFKTSLAAGYHPQHIGRFYNKLQQMEEAHQKGQGQLLAPITDALSTHPPSRERVAQMQQLAREFSSQKGKVSGAEYDKVKKRVS